MIDIALSAARRAAFKEAVAKLRLLADEYEAKDRCHGVQRYGGRQNQGALAIDRAANVIAALANSAPAQVAAQPHGTYTDTGGNHWFTTK